MFGTGGDFVDNVFQRYRDKTTKVNSVDNEFNSMLSDLNYDSSNFWRDINTQKRRAGTQLDKGATYFGNAVGMEDINLYGQNSAGRIFSQGLTTGTKALFNSIEKNKTEDYSAQLGDKKYDDFVDWLNSVV